MRLPLVAAVLVLVVCGLAGVWWLGGPDLHRWAAHRALELVLDRDVQIDGTLEVELSAEPLLRLTGLRIDAPPWAEARTLLRVERAQVRIALWPLLRRVLVFSSDRSRGRDGHARDRHRWSQQLAVGQRICG
jgi:hypothetical protein